MASRTESARGTRSLRATHRREVVDLLRSQGPQARTEIAERLGLARSAVTAIVAELIEEGVLHELERSQPALGPAGRPVRGRPRTLVGCDPGAASVLAAQVGARWARVVLADAAGDALAHATADVTGADPGEVVARVGEVAEALVADHGGSTTTAAGICVPGAVDTVTGTVLRSEALGWTDVPLAALLRERLGMPVFAQDVTQAATLAEARHGAAMGASDAVVVDYGGRIGVGLVIDGRLHRGASGTAGTIGHIPVLGDRTPCRCGRSGCLEAVAGVRAMVGPAPRGGHGPDDEVAAFARSVEQLRRGDSETEAVVAAALDRGAHAVASAVALVDPEVVVLTGLVVAYPDLAARLLGRVEGLLPSGPRHPLLRTSTLGVGAWVRGAILVALQQLQPEVGGALAGAGAAMPRAPSGP